MSKRDIWFNFSYKQACIIKHALLDKQNRDKEEELYQAICNEVNQFKARCGIKDKPYEKGT